MADAIVTRQLIKNYGSRRVVNCLDLSIPTGCVYGFLGRNGAGKSTTIRMLTGMVHPDSGSVELLGEEISAMRPETRQRIAYLAEGHPLYQGMRIGEAVRFTRSFYRHWNGRLAEQVLDHFELSRKARIGRLSRGQQAQVSLALAIAPDPELLILDDPTLGLDTVVRRDFLESLIQIISQEGRTILFSSHMLGDVERVADRIGVLVDGVLRVDCPTDQFVGNLRRVLVDFSGPPPVFSACPGVVSSRAVGNCLELVIVSYGTLHQQRIEQLEPREIEVQELNLEDAFIEYTRGEKRSLPLFTTESEHVAVAAS